MPYYLDEATPQELDEIRTRMYRAIPESSNGRYSPGELRPVDEVYRDFINAGDSVAVMRYRGTIVGYIHFGRRREETYSPEEAGHIFDIFVEEAHRKRGIATQLLDHALYRMYSQGYRKVSGNTFRGGPGWEILLKRGFRPDTVCLSVESRSCARRGECDVSLGVPADLLMFSEGLTVSRAELAQDLSVNLSGLFYRLNAVIEKGATLLIASRGDSPAGFMVYSVFEDLMTYDFLGYLDFIFVAQPFRRLGVAGNLLCESLRRLKGVQAREMFFECNCDAYCHKWALSAGMKEFSILLEKDLDRL
jgi:GNAT superfamily N-acetyltransferase